MAELWKQCGEWLVRLGVLPSNHRWVSLCTCYYLCCPCQDPCPHLLACFRISWPDATVQDLAYAVRDGVLLCHLLHTIDPATVDMRLVNQRPSLAQFLCLKNIRLFLSALTRCFEMSETDLFQPSMLYDYSDFAQVSYLSFIYCCIHIFWIMDVQKKQLLNISVDSVEPVTRQSQKSPVSQKNKLTLFVG